MKSDSQDPREAAPRRYDAPTLRVYGSVLKRTLSNPLPHKQDKDGLPSTKT
ncbi:MAG: hypothetical protein JWO05_1731 [Gemmatimonadetes bacterium]|nr:hypothetical protein [Gemmatimonadota bacterium]